jgi:hypothetical protein
MKPRYIAWPTNKSHVHGYTLVEVVRANGLIERYRACNIMWDHYRTNRKRSEERFIAYRVIEQENKQ